VQVQQAKCIAYHQRLGITSNSEQITKILKTCSNWPAKQPRLEGVQRVQVWSMRLIEEQLQPKKERKFVEAHLQLTKA